MQILRVSVAKTNAFLYGKQVRLLFACDSPAIRFNLFEMLLCCDEVSIS